MSMWEIEALAEQTVILVSESGWSDREKRNAYASIYTLTGGFDTSFTHFRNVHALADASFFLRIEVTQHPHYEARQAELDALGKDTWLQDAHGGYEAFFSGKGSGSHAPGIWFDVTMPLWKRAVDAGLVRGLAAEPFEVWPPKDTIVRLMTLAAAMARPRVLKMLHGFVVMALADVEAGDPDLAPTLALPGISAALLSQADGEHDRWIDERFDAREALKWFDDPRQRAFVAWWCGPFDDA